VLKVGSSSLTFAGGGLDAEALGNVAGMVASAWSAGFPTVLVTSGAVATGLPILGLNRRPKGLAEYQVAAAVGQSRLMQHYADALANHGLIGGQVLLTKDVLANRQQYLHSRGALLKMIELGIVPVINENDIVVVDELKFGDNDRLAAIVSHLVSAQLMVLLTDTAGLYTDDPRRADDAELLSAVRHTDEILDEVSAGASGPLGSGGIATKVAAARMAAWSGIPTVIGPSKQPDVLAEILAGNEVGTWVAPQQSGLSARKLWIAFGLPSDGRIIVDGGAEEAIRQSGRSLLSVGATRCDGGFVAGQAVEVVGQDGSLIAKGIVRFDAADFATATGEMIHRDDLVLLV
jgi:glutamate 5-kinase